MSGGKSNTRRYLVAVLVLLVLAGSSASALPSPLPVGAASGFESALEIRQIAITDSTSVGEVFELQVRIRAAREFEDVRLSIDLLESWG